MENEMEYIQQVIQQYKADIAPLLRYLPWLRSKSGSAVSTIYNGQNIAETSITFPVYDGTLLNFVREASKTPLMERNYQYVYTRNYIRTHKDEKKVIEKATWREWNLLRGIISKYVLGGRTKATLWNEAMQEGIFYLVLDKMVQIIEYWERAWNEEK